MTTRTAKDSVARKCCWALSLCYCIFAPSLQCASLQVVSIDSVQSSVQARTEAIHFLSNQRSSSSSTCGQYLFKSVSGMHPPLHSCLSQCPTKIFPPPQSSYGMSTNLQTDRSCVRALWRLLCVALCAYVYVFRVCQLESNLYV